VEGTGSYGAALARFLAANDQLVMEVNRPDRAARRRHGQSDPVDAQAAAKAVQAGTATVAPKTGCGQVEMIRCLRVARQTAMRARTQTINASRRWSSPLRPSCVSSFGGCRSPGWSGRRPPWSQARSPLVATGDNPGRLHSEAAFSMLCGASPIQASSGKTSRHRLNRGGDRQANAALYRIVLVRLC